VTHPAGTTPEQSRPTRNEAAELPPCPICGKDDLFMGRDGKPGCPHCEVAVRLAAPTASKEER
jgi:hypothetical protein